MRKFLFVSFDALITDIAWRVAREGHDVRLYIDHAEKQRIGDGFVDKSNDWRKDVDWADVIVFDDVLGMGAWAAELRAAGKHVVGGTAYTDQLEDDRSFGQSELKKHGVTILPFREFDSFDDAIAFVRESPAAYVVKPSGEAQNIKRLLFVGQEDDGKDVIQVLETYKKLYSEQVKVFQLQKRVKGVEVAVGAFFNGKQFVSPININFEHKKLFPGNIGPSTGEMGTLMYWSEKNRLYNRTLARLESTLAAEGYVGYIDLNCIVNNQGIYPLEFTSRFGYPTIMIQAAGMLTPVGDFLGGLADGSLDKFRTRSGFQIGVRIVVPPYPYQDMDAFRAMSQDAAILFKRPNYDGICIEDVREERGEWLIAGVSGVALVVVGLGQTVKQAQAQAYQRIQNIMIPNMYYRTDIGDRWFEDSDRLHNWGYLREG